MFEAGNTDPSGFQMYFAVCVNPQGRGSFELYRGGCIMIDLRKYIMPSKECRGQCKKDQKPGQISYDAQIQKAIAVIGLRAEAESAALIGMDHKSGKQ